MADQQRLDWTLDVAFFDEEISVSVNKLPLRRPRFSVSVSCDRGERPSRFLPVQSSIDLGKATMTSFADRVHKLLQLAETHIAETLQAVADEEIEQKLDRELRQVNRGPKPVVGLSGGPGSGKTARRREAKRAAKVG